MPKLYKFDSSLEKPDISLLEDGTRFSHPRYVGCVFDGLMSAAQGLSGSSTINDWSVYREIGTFQGNGSAQIAAGPHEQPGVVYVGNQGASSTRCNYGDAVHLRVTGELTITAWVKQDPSITSTQGVLTKYQGAGDDRDYFLGVEATSQAVSFRLSSDGTFGDVKTLNGASSTIVPGPWHHIAATFKPSTYMRVWHNGRLNGEDVTSIEASIHSSVAQLWLGSQFDTTSTRSFAGCIEQPRIYNRILSDPELYSLYTDPWLEYYPANPRIWFFTSVGGDVTAPVLSAATVNATSLVLTYDEALDTGSTPATTDFSIGTDGDAQTVTLVVVSGMMVTLTLSPGVAVGDTVTITYTAGANPIQDLAGNDAANLVAEAVTNTTVDASLIGGNVAAIRKALRRKCERRQPRHQNRHCP